MSPLFTSYSTPTLPNSTFVSQKHILIPFLLLCSRPLNKPLALNRDNLHPSTLDYHILNSLHQLHIDPFVDPFPHMITLSHKCRERAYCNILRTTISTLWRMDLLNQAPLHLPHTSCRLTTFTLPVMTSSTVIFSNLHNTFAPTSTNYPYSAFEPKPPPTSHPTSTLPMTTHTPSTNSAIAPLASLSRSWVLNPTPSYTVPTLSPSPTLSSSALPALFVDMISAPGPHTPHSNKLQFSLGPVPLNSSAKTTKHGLTLPPLHAHNLSTHFNLIFLTPTLSLSRARTVPLLLPYQPPL